MAGGASFTGPSQSLGGAWQAHRGIFDLPGRWSRPTAFSLIVSLIGLLLVAVIRLLIVADYSPATASAIASSGGYVDTLLGAIIPLVPLFAPYLALVLLFFNRVILAILTILATAFMTPVATTRAAALGVANDEWHSITHRSLLGIIVMAVLGLAFVFLLILVFLGPGFGGLLAAIAVSVSSQAPQGAYLVVWALELFLIVRLIWRAASWAVQYLVVTQKRLILTSGALGRKVTALPLAALQNLAFSRSAGGRLLGYGAFTFEADGQARAVIDYIPYPEQIYLEIYHLLYPEEAGEDADPGEELAPGGDDGLDFDDL